jgi:hypothetical protein
MAICVRRQNSSSFILSTNYPHLIESECSLRCSQNDDTIMIQTNAIHIFLPHFFNTLTYFKMNLSFTPLSSNRLLLFQFRCWNSLGISHNLTNASCLECDAVYVGRSLPTFQRHILPPVESYSCRLSAWLTLTLFKILSAYSCGRSENFYRILWHHIAECHTLHTLPQIRQSSPSILLCLRFECKEHTCTVTLSHVMFTLNTEVFNLDYWSSYQSPPRLNVTS